MWDEPEEKVDEALHKYLKAISKKISKPFSPITTPQKIKSEKIDFDFKAFKESIPAFNLSSDTKAMKDEIQEAAPMVDVTSINKKKKKKKHNALEVSLLSNESQTMDENEDVEKDSVSHKKKKKKAKHRKNDELTDFDKISSFDNTVTSLNDIPQSELCSPSKSHKKKKKKRSMVEQNEQEININFGEILSPHLHVDESNSPKKKKKRKKDKKHNELDDEDRDQIETEEIDSAQQHCMSGDSHADSSFAFFCPLLDSGSPKKKRKKSEENMEESSSSLSLSNDMPNEEDNSNSDFLPRLKESRFKVGDDFEQHSLQKMASTYISKTEMKGKELWLIKLPFDVKPQSFNGEKFGMNGTNICKCQNKVFQIAPVPEKSKKNQFCPVLPDPDKDRYSLEHSLSGTLHVMESLDVPLKPEIQISPRKEIPLPPGLKVRYVPFGAGDSVPCSPKKSKKKKKK